MVATMTDEQIEALVLVRPDMAQAGGADIALANAAIAAAEAVIGG